MILDCHVHIFPDDIAAHAVSKVAGERSGNRPVFCDATARGVRQKLTSIGVLGCVVMNIATKPAQQATINDWANSLDRDFFIPFGAVHPYAEDTKEELRRIKGFGFMGIKLHPYYQDFDLLDPRAVALYGMCEELGLNIQFHTGLDSGYPGRMLAPANVIADIAAAHPKISVIAAHFGAFRQWEEAERYIIGRDIYIDTAHLVGDLSKEQARRMLLSHRPDRILFGSDCPWYNTDKAVAFIRSLGLPQELLDKIFYKNTAALFSF